MADKIQLNYYGNGGNKYSTGKKTHFCAICRIEISASTSSIMFHEKSKTHQDNKRAIIDKSH